MKKTNETVIQELRDNQELQQIINGYIMGDGYVKKEGNMTVDQGSEQHGFVLWLHDKLKPILTDTSEVKLVGRNRKGTETKTVSYRFNTRNVLKDYHSNWYLLVDGKYTKQLPTNIADLFTPLFITVWFACDGTKTIGSKGAKFEVTFLSADHREQLKHLFKSKHDIAVKINKNGLSSAKNQQWVIAIPSEEYDKFRSLITQYDLIQNLFPYKLHTKT